jgi:hypothetical protein
MFVRYSLSRSNPTDASLRTRWMRKRRKGTLALFQLSYRAFAPTGLEPAASRLQVEVALPSASSKILERGKGAEVAALRQCKLTVCEVTPTSASFIFPVSWRRQSATAARSRNTNRPPPRLAAEAVRRLPLGAGPPFVLLPSVYHIHTMSLPHRCQGRQVFFTKPSLAGLQRGNR